LGWKEVVRMNPLEDVIVALRPKTMTLPFKLGNSHRTQDPGNATPAINTAMSFNLDPTSGNASDIANTAWNYGWEYVWHCHILGHEENDFMRSIAVATQPETPVASDATGASTTVTVNWTDKSVVSNWVEIKRATDPAFTQNVVPVIKLLKDVVVNPADLVNGECANQAGCAMSYKDTVPDNSSYYYQVRSNNTVGSGKGVLEGGFAAAGGYNQTLDPALDALLPVNSAGTAGFAGYGNVTANSAWSNTVSRIGLTLNAAGGLASNLATWTSNNASTSSVALNFTDNSTNESGYQVQFCQGGATNCLANAPVNATTSNVASNSNRWYTLPAANVTGTVLPGTGAASLTLTGLRISNATGYFFRIYPLNGAIVGPVSNISTIMDLTSRPADPTNVTATSAVGSSAATIAWVDASNANANYTLQLRHVNFLASATRNSTGSKRYSVRPTVVFTGGTGSGAAGTATLNGNGQVTGINITNGGTYTVAPTISLAGGTVSSGTTDSVFTANITLQTLAFSNPTVNTVTPNPLNGIATSATVTGNNMQIGGSYQFQVRANGAVGGNNSNYVIAAAVVIK
jgi:hypothetical protein